MKVKTAELEGIALDYAVAIAINGKVFVYPDGGFYPPAGSVSLGAPGCINLNDGKGDIKPWRPSADWSQGGPLIDTHDVNLTSCLDLKGAVIGDHISGFVCNAENFLVAAMRCIVMAKLGEEVEIPDELCEVRE